MNTRIKTFIRNQFSLFHDNFIDSVSASADSSIHDFRIASKRIKTVARFMEFLEGGNKISALMSDSGISKSFKTAGHLRELSVNLQLLNELETVLKTTFIPIRSELGLLKSGRAVDFIRVWKNFPDEKFFELEFVILLHIESLAFEYFTIEFEKFIMKRLVRIRNLVLSDEAALKLHIIRKQIKNIKYGLEWCGLRSKYFGNKSYSQARITLIEDKIGLWHDWLVFNRFLAEVNDRILYDNIFEKEMNEQLMALAAEQLKEKEQSSLKMIRNYFTYIRS